MIHVLLWLVLIPAGAPRSLSDADLRHVVITLKRSPCYGDCPIYEVRITGDGKVRYHGERFVRRKGNHTGTISPEKIRKLVAAFEEAGYFSLPESTACNDRKLCPTGYMYDSPSADTAITLRGRTHEVFHDYGCTCAPPSLFKLERAIDEIAGSSRWVGKKQGGQWAGTSN